MMGGRCNQPAGPMTVTEQQARANAQQFLDGNFPGAKLADDADTFYGYYTMDFLQERQDRRHAERQRLHRAGVVPYLARGIRRRERAY